MTAASNPTVPHDLPLSDADDPLLALPEPTARHHCTQGCPSGWFAAMVMGLVKMAPDGWAYYATEIADGREDYFAREERGCWLGRGAEHIGLSGQVDALGLERLFAGARHPTTDSALGRPFGTGKSAVAGYALSFSPPKSVSVVWALGDDEIAGQVRAGHDAAVRAAVSYLERHAAFTRRGRAGVFQTDTRGLLGAVFVHRTSRALDPQLHTHVLLSNKVQDATDGAWLALDGSELYTNQKAAGMLYKAALRAELSARLGLSWTAVDENGIAEIDGVPKALLEHWSTRRKEVTTAAKVLIAEREQALGRRLTNPERTEAHQLAAYRTRGAKGTETHATAELRAGWRQEAEALGLGPERWMEAVLAPPAARRLAPGTETLLERARVVLQESSSTWRRAEAVEVMSTLLEHRALENPSALRMVEAVELATEALLASRGVLSLAVPPVVEELAEHLRRDGLPTHCHHGATRYSTEETLRRETEVLEIAARGAAARRAVVDACDLERRLAVAGLGEDQAAAVRRMCLGGEALCCVTGPAGAGKTRMLAVATGAFEAAGHQVLGLAPSARAAAVLKVEAAMASDTLARFLLRAEAGSVDLRAGDVVVLDEATMASSADLARLVRLVDGKSAKLVAIGDPAQLGAVGAGGLFATLATDTRAEALGLPRRFLHAWEKTTVLQLRARDQQVVEAYTLHNRITDAGRDDAVDKAFAHWQAARAEGASVLLLASDHETVDALNDAVRAARAQAGEVEERGLVCRGQLVGVGDEVVTLRNDRTLTTTKGEWVRNGERWSVVDRTDHALLLSHAEGRGEL
ncbi:MAG TPA: MobF family relaxase, partial [Acidimicrobiales bacterium]|nr:MobF family relaxase [Acidimicrobiales bacterium]